MVSLSPGTGRRRRSNTIRLSMSETAPTPEDVVTMDKIVALCKRRGFIFPSSEI